MLRWLTVVAALGGAGAPLAAQSEAVLKEYFEGRTVAPKLAMPGTEAGVDVYPGSPRPLDYDRYAGRLKEYGTAIRPGDPVTVTKVKVKAKHIEFQLGGGGYGTFGDETSSGVATQTTPKTQREKHVEAELQRESDPAKKRALKEELDDLKNEREREDAHNRSMAAEAEEQRKANIRQLRLESGSRFNLRFANGVPPEALHPEAVIRALEEYLDFGSLKPEERAGSPPPRTGSSGTLHKGMLLLEVDQVLGAALSTTERKEGSLKLVQRKYSSSMGQVTADFVEGVLIRYTVTSE